MPVRAPASNIYADSEQRRLRFGSLKLTQGRTTGVQRHGFHGLDATYTKLVQPDSFPALPAAMRCRELRKVSACSLRPARRSCSSDNSVYDRTCCPQQAHTGSLHCCSAAPASLSKHHTGRQFGGRTHMSAMVKPGELHLRRWPHLQPALAELAGTDPPEHSARRTCAGQLATQRAPACRSCVQHVCTGSHLLAFEPCDIQQTSERRYHTSSSGNVLSTCSLHLTSGHRVGTVGEPPTTASTHNLLSRRALA